MRERERERERVRERESERERERERERGLGNLRTLRLGVVVQAESSLEHCSIAPFHDCCGWV